MWSDSCTLIGQLDWEKIDLIRTLKHLVAILLCSCAEWWLIILYSLFTNCLQLVEFLEYPEIGNNFKAEL